MKARAAILLLALLLLPSVALASTLQASESLTVSETQQGNAYLAGSRIVVDAAVLGDLIAAGNEVAVSALIDGDILAAGSDVRINAPVTGDVRVAGAKVIITEPIDGEVAAFGGSVSVQGSAREMRVAGMNVEIAAGASGPVTVYGSRVSLAGEFAGDVRVIAADQVMLAPGTVINGTLEYNAPQEAMIPASASVVGGARYIGTASFLPTTAEAQTFALAGFGIFFIVRILAAMVTAGLLAGLFPAFARTIATEALAHEPKHLIFLSIIGFAALVATPFIFLFLIASVVGIGVAFLIGSAYLFCLFLAYLYSALLAGAALDRLIRKKTDVSWHHAVVGMLALYIIGFIPVIGFIAGLILLSLALGAMLRTVYLYAFPPSVLHE